MKMNKLESHVVLARFMGAQVTHGQPEGGEGFVDGHYPFNTDYEQDGVLFTYRSATVNGKNVETSPGLYRNMSSASMQYHKSLDWMMPVLNKVQESDFPNLRVLEVLSNFLGDLDFTAKNLFEVTANYLYKTRPHLYSSLKEAKS